MPVLNTTFKANGGPLQSTMSGLQSKMASFGSSIAGQLGMAFSAGAIMHFTRSLTQAGAQLYDMQKATGFSAESIQRVKYMLDQSGGSVEDFSKAIKSMNKNLLGAAPSAASLISLKKINITLSDLKKMAPEEKFFAIAKGLSQVEDVSLRSAYAQELFGRSGANMLPMLAEYNNLLDESKDKAIFTQEDIDSSKRFEDSITRVVYRVRAAVVKSGIAQTLEAAAKGLEILSTPSESIGGFFADLKNAATGGLSFKEMASFISPEDILGPVTGVGASALRPKELFSKEDAERIRAEIESIRRQLPPATVTEGGLQ